MSDSLVLYLDRNEILNVIDPDVLPDTDRLEPLIDIVIAIINAGYVGVRLDYEKLTDGRHFLAINFNTDTIEGKIIEELNRVNEKELPTPQSVVDKIKAAYTIGIGRS